MKSCIHLMLILFAITLLPACATVTKGMHERVVFETDPPGARVVTEVETTASKTARKKDKSLTPEYFSCEPTPCEIRLHKRTNTVATLTYPGMEPLEFAITSGTSRRAIMPNVTGGAATGAALGAAGVAIGASLGMSTGAAISAAAGPVGLIAVAVGGSMLTVDAATGASQKLSPNPMVVTMVPLGTEIIPDPFVAKVRELNSGQRSPNLRCGDPRVMTTRRQAQCKAQSKALAKEREPDSEPES